MEEIVNAIAAAIRTDAARVTPEASLQSLGVGSSIVLEILRTALERRFQKTMPPLSLAMKVNELMALVRNEDTVQAEIREIPYPTTQTTPTPSLLSLVGVGIDIEEVESLPDVSHLRDHPFYMASFSPEELAVAILKPDPRAHLCGIFCAKEAVRKCSPSLISLRFDEILTFHENGKPGVTTTFPKLNGVFRFELSISHTSCYATAIVIALRA